VPGRRLIYSTDVLQRTVPRQQPRAVQRADGRYTDPPILDEANLRAVARALSGHAEGRSLPETLSYAKKGTSSTSTRPTTGLRHGVFTAYA